jgi:hypothetical protein
MAENLGGKPIAGPVIAVGNQKALFDALVLEGECHGMDAVITGQVISSGAAFPAKNPTGANKLALGLDDLDKFLDAVFTNSMFRVDEATKLWDGELMSIVRAALSGLNATDFAVSGALVDGAVIPISTGAAIPFGIRASIPFSLREELFPLDGDQYKIGTLKLKKGGFFPQFKQVAGNIALVNGTAVLSNLAMVLVPKTDTKGDPSYSGPTYKIESNLTEKAETTTLRRAKRIFLFATNTATGGPYTINGHVKTDQQDAASFIAAFNQNRRATGGDNTCAKIIPLIWPRKNVVLAEKDHTPEDLYVKDFSGAATQGLISVTHEPEDQTVAGRIKGEVQQNNGGQKVVRYTPTPPSAHGSDQVHGRNKSALGGGFIKAPR